MKRANLPSREQALIDYIALGVDRSLSKLHVFYKETLGPERAPGLTALKNWSRQGDWQIRVHEHELQVSGLVQSLAIEGTAEAHLDMARNLHNAGNRLITKIVAMVERVRGGDVAQANVITDIALKLSKHALEIERGRPPSTERLREIMDSIPKPEGDKGGDVTELPAGGTPTAPPQSTDSILRQFDAITGADKGRPN
jgi:hypothetical protein